MSHNNKELDQIEALIKQHKLLIRKIKNLFMLPYTSELQFRDRIKGILERGE